jgi:hypothetical protein
VIVDGSDAFLLKILAGCPPLSPAEARQVEGWWQAERSASEGLAAFLIRQGVFTKEALKTVDFMLRGYVTFSDARHLFTMHGQDKARNRGSAPGSRPALVSSWSSLQLPLPHVPADEDALARTERKPALQHVVAVQSYRQPAPPRTLKPGMTLGKCLLTAEIGRGGSGVVFRGYHQGLNIPVAVKVLQLDGVGSDRTFGDQLHQEACLLAQLNHPHIVRVLDFENDPVQPYLVLEYVEGLSLNELIRQSGRLRSDRAARVILQTAQALEAAHRLGIVHRDVKPANILITRDGSAKLADLGLAVVIGGRLGSDACVPLDTLAGTVAYMPPEQALKSGGVDQRSDIYALGATFYHAVTGQMPFTGRTRNEVIQKHARELPLPPTAAAADIDPAVSAVIMQMLAKDPSQRFQDYAGLIEALTRIETRSGIQSRCRRRVRRRSCRCPAPAISRAGCGRCGAV